MEQSRKILSVVVPSYNMEAYLPRCLGSLVVPDGTLMKRLDVLVVNDGSKDRTSEIAHDFKRRYPGVFRVIDKANGNYGSCINVALPEARGVYVKILDADDWVDTATFQRFLDLLEDEVSRGKDSADLVAANYSLVDPAGKERARINHSFPPGRDHSLDDLAPLSTRFLLQSITYRTEVVRSIGYRQTEGVSYTDIEWTLEPMVKVKCVTFFPESVVRYLIGREGQTVDPDKYARNYDQVVQIVTGLVSRYECRLSQCNEISRRYFDKHFLQLLSLVYEAFCFGVQGRRVSGNLKKIDEAIRATPVLFGKTESFRYLSKSCPVRLIRAWRRHPGRGTPALIRFGLFLRLKSLKARLRH